LSPNVDGFILFESDVSKGTGWRGKREESVLVQLKRGRLYQLRQKEPRLHLEPNPSDLGERVRRDLETIPSFDH